MTAVTMDDFAGEVKASERSRLHPLVLSYYLIIGSTGVLLVLGLVMVFSSSSVTSLAAGGSVLSAIKNQGLFAVVGLIGAWLCSRLSLVRLKKIAPPLIVFAILAQGLVLVPSLGKSSGGNQNWIHIGPLQAQPSEFLKLALVLYLGAALAVKRSQLNKWKQVAGPVLVCLLALGLVLAGHDKGTFFIMMLLIMGAFFAAGLSMRIWAAGGLAGAGIAVVLIISSSMVRSRIGTAFRLLFHSSVACIPQNVTKETWQSCQASYALANGGITGVGLGASHEKWSWLSQANNDFIFAIIGEELGLLGTLLVLVLFTILIIGMLQVVLRHSDFFAKVVAAGLVCWIGGQALVNIGMVIGVLPVIGVPLPFISDGGSALISSLLAIGIMVALIRSDAEAAEAMRTRPRLLPEHVGVFAARAHRSGSARAARRRVSSRQSARRKASE